jgi:hypothetical protein
MGYPHPDVVFLNDTSHPVLITTHHGGYRGGGITVRFWGDNDGRRVKGWTSKRYDFGTLQVIYKPNRDLDPSTEVVISSGAAPYSIDVFRRITEADGTRTTEEWSHRYNSPRVVETHPCNIPGSGVACPD